jgi:gluconokinase
MNQPVTGQRVIVVIGVSGCGKTTLGTLVAAELRAAFLDADDFHPPENVEKMRSGIALTDADRAPWLTRLNAELAARRARGESVVLACSALKRAYRSAIGAAIHPIDWVFLDGSFDAVAARLRARANHYMPESLLKSQFDTLERPSDAICVSISLTPAEQAQAVLYALAKDAPPPTASAE